MGRIYKVLVVPKFVAALRPVSVRGIPGPETDQGSACCLDLLCHGHEVAVAADDDHRADMAESADVLRRIEAKLDVGTILGRTARRESWINSTAACNRASQYRPKNCQLQ